MIHEWKRLTRQLELDRRLGGRGRENGKSPTAKKGKGKAVITPDPLDIHTTRTHPLGNGFPVELSPPTSNALHCNNKLVNFNHDHPPFINWARLQKLLNSPKPPPIAGSWFRQRKNNYWDLATTLSDCNSFSGAVLKGWLKLTNRVWAPSTNIVEVGVVSFPHPRIIESLVYWSCFAWGT